MSEYAARALRANVAMQREFARRDGAYRRDGLLGRLGFASHLWPFARAFVATLDLAGIDPELRPGFDAEGEIARHVGVFERFWEEPAGRPGAYASDPPWLWFGHDRYHDDNAWVALALIQLTRMSGATDHLARVQQLWQFAVAGWDRSPSSEPGGVFWVEQGRGIGRKNHDRNAVSNAPNAEVGLHLAELGVGIGDAPAGPVQMFEWVAAHLDAGGDGDGLYRDKICGDGSLDVKLWSYNQGSMLGAAALLARRASASGEASGGPLDAARWLGRAEEIARRALRKYAGDAAFRDRPEFMAIMFRNLLLLESFAGEDLGTVAAMRAYADVAWERYRDGSDRFAFPGQPTTLLSQSGMVQILALLAWQPDAYRQLA